jgi:glutamyl-tRNA synthetase
MYDRLCLRLPQEEVEKRLAAGEPHVLRLKVPHERTVSFHDAIRGEMKFMGHTIDDQVLIKSDRFPTYHLAHVVDDHLMEIDMVIRGEEWLSSLPKHLLLFEFLGWKPPQYAHVPLLLNANRSKLSKREGAVAVEEFMTKGYLPETLVNFLALLGWNPGTTEELFSLPELIERFSLERVQKAGAVFDLQKLDWLQGQWIRKLPLQEFSARIRPLVVKQFPAAAQDASFEEKAALIQERITFFSEAPDMLGFFYETPKPTLDLLLNEKQKVTQEILTRALALTKKILTDITPSAWSEETLLAAFKEAAKTQDLKLGQMLWPLRAAITGRPFSPGATEVAAMLGKDETLRRVEHAASLRN